MRRWVNAVRCIICQGLTFAAFFEAAGVEQAAEARECKRSEERA